MHKELELSEIIHFIAEKTGYEVEEIRTDTDIAKDVGMYGDDWHEFIEGYAQKYEVNMENYLWYFHAEEEGIGCLGQMFFLPPNERVKRIPITPAMLLEYAKQQKWTLEYPSHNLPAYRCDILINQIIVIIWLIVCLSLGLYSWL